LRDGANPVAGRQSLDVTAEMWNEYDGKKGPLDVEKVIVNA
jgi:hypothetical protein